MKPLTLPSDAVTADRPGPFIKLGGRYDFGAFGRLTLSPVEADLSSLTVFIGIIHHPTILARTSPSFKRLPAQLAIDRRHHQCPHDAACACTAGEPRPDPFPMTDIEPP